MKLVKQFAIICLVALSVIACNKDDEGSGEASLIGTWQLTSSKFNGETEILDECDLMSTITFGETTISFKNYEGVDCEDLLESEVTYTRDGDFIEVVGSSVTVEITKLNSSTLELTENEDGDVFVITYDRQ